MSDEQQKRLSLILQDLDQLRLKILPEIQKELDRGSLFRDKQGVVQAASLFGQMLAMQGLLIQELILSRSKCRILCPYSGQPVLLQDCQDPK